MTEPSSSLAHFPWVYKRDGRLVPFEADKISRALFAVTENLGQPDAFLARELTDAVLHFLGTEADGSIPTTAEVGETVVKVVRELGHPRLAQEFAQRRLAPPAAPSSAEPTPAAAAETALLAEVARGVEGGLTAAGVSRHLTRACLRTYSLRSVFSRDLVAAHHDGLITLGHLESPLELAGALLPPWRPEIDRSPGGFVEWIEEARGHVGEYLALDGPEYALPSEGDAETAVQYARELRIGLRVTGLRAVVNLNAAQSPAWAGDPAEGPLFAGQRQPSDRDKLNRQADDLLEALLSRGIASRVRVDWHLAERDFAPEAATRLARLARRAVEGAALTFVFDRPRRPLPLAEGLDRRHVAALLTVGLNLPRLAEQPGLRSDPGLFVQKLGSLVRMALSAASQKRDFLRRHGQARPALTRGFQLQRARLVLAPVGLEATARLFHGRGLCDGGAAQDFARQVFQRLRETLRQDGAAHHLDTCLDGPASHCLEEADPLPSAAHVAGATAWDEQAPPRQQLRAAGTLQAIAEMGTAAVVLPAEQPLAAEEAVELLRLAWQKTDVVRLRFVRVAPAARQLTAPWAP